MPSDILKKQNLTIGFNPKLFTRKTLYTFFGINNCKYKPLIKNLLMKFGKEKKKKTKINSINCQITLPEMTMKIK